jgi:pilus assembly protein CpaF
MSEIFKFERRGLSEEGEVLGSLVPTGMVPQCRETLEKKGIPLDPGLFDPEYF